MCGIVGLLLKKPSLRPRLGELMVPMMIGMTERGADSAGLAVFTEPVAEARYKLSLYADDNVIDWKGFCRSLSSALAGTHEIKVSTNHAVLTTSAAPETVQQWIETDVPALTVLSIGRSIDLYKDTGAPAEVAKRYDFVHLQGTHLVGHTRMATESAVTPAHAHPFTAGYDFCVVHNGSLSNPHLVRRKLEPYGIRFETDNDTEAACRYFEWRLREGDDLETAVHRGFEELDGFYTFLMGTESKLALVRDAFACKPAMVAETDDYVAVASEFRSLAHLPGVREANLFEPKPQEVYAWRV
jgi:methylamine---glutamate N-methyltransferase subunit A